MHQFNSMSNNFSTKSGIFGEKKRFISENRLVFNRCNGLGENKRSLEGEVIENFL